MKDKKKVSRERQAKKKMRKKTASVFLHTHTHVTTEIFLYRFEYFNLHYITKWLVEAMFVNFLSWANL